MMLLRTHWVISLISILFTMPVIASPNNTVDEQENLFQKYKSLVNIVEGDGEIIIVADDVPIGVLLRTIETKTGIHLIVPHSIWNDNIKINVTVSNWKAGLNKILEAYDRVGIWNLKLELSSVRIISRKTHAEVQEFQQAEEYLFEESEQVEVESDSPLETLSFDQLTEIANGRLRSPLPPDLFDDPDIIDFLEQFGITSIEEGQDSVKAMKARVEARNRLRKVVD